MILLNLILALLNIERLGVATEVDAAARPTDLAANGTGALLIRNGRGRLNGVSHCTAMAGALKSPVQAD